MQTITKVLALGGVAVLGLAACSSDDDEAATSTAAGPPVTFDVNLTGAEEVPGPGASGSGAARITVTPGTTDVCATITVDGLDEVTGTHIHEGQAGTAGPIAVTLMPPTSGSSEGCVKTSASIVDALATGSRAFYVNVHTNQHPDGAVRSQLTGPG